LADLTLQLGVKTDPVQYRYSYPWLFRLLAEEGISLVQLGTFFEIYQLPDEYFLQLRRQAEDLGIRIQSVFTAHRELGGFFADESGFEDVACRNYRRLIEVAALLGAQSAGSNPGAVYRDRMETKACGLRRYVRQMKELMGYAHQQGVPWLTIEPMSCLAEPPTLPEEIRQVAAELAAWHAEHPGDTAGIGYCADISHGYADQHGKVCCDHLELLEATLPHLVELHLKNTDARYCSTFGFGPEERKAGIIQIQAVREMLSARADLLPVDTLVGYLEIGGPKLGRDYSDSGLAGQLRASLAYLKEVWPTAEGRPATVCPPPPARPPAPPARPVKVAPSLMCADLGHMEQAVRQLEAAGADMLHIDLADGHFVPNLLLGPDAVRWLRPRTGLPIDVHLMVESPERYVEAMGAIGVDWLSVHAEACPHLDRVLGQIREHGMKAGVALNPATSLSALEYLLERLDFVLLMTVNPGFAGQKLVPSAIRRIRDCRAMLDGREREVPITVDGNVSFQHIPQMVAAGAGILVAGTSSWFDRGASLAANVQRTKEAIADGLRSRSKTT
jgi:ribulose-phosphate 3-epimerase